MKIIVKFWAKLKTIKLKLKENFGTTNKVYKTLAYA